MTAGNNNQFSVDYEHEYRFANDTGSGSLELVGIQQGSTAGYRWHNTMLMGKDTHTYLDIEYPNRDNLFTTENISHDFRGFTANLSNSYSDTIGGQASTNSEATSGYLSTTERKLFGSNVSGVRMTTNFSVNDDNSGRV